MSDHPYYDCCPCEKCRAYRQHTGSLERRCQPPAPAASAGFLEDSFTGAEGTEIESHTGEGGAWRIIRKEDYDCMIRKAPADAGADEDLELPGPTMGTSFPVGTDVEEVMRLVEAFVYRWNYEGADEGCKRQLARILAARTPVPDAAVLAAAERLRRNVTETFEVDGKPYNSDPDILAVCDWIDAAGGKGAEG